MFFAAVRIMAMDEGDGGPELRRPTPQEVQLPRKHSRRPSPAPIVVGLPGDHRRLQRPSALASARGTARPPGGTLRSFRPATDEDRPVDEQSRSSSLEATPGRAATARVLTGLLRDAGAHAAAEAVLGSGGNGEGGGERGDAGRVWAREWHHGVGW